MKQLFLKAVCIAMIVLCALVLSAGTLDTEEYPTAGDMGSGFTWRLEAGTLYISGSGEMPSGCDKLWNALAAEVESIEVGSGITSIAPQAFQNMPNLLTVTLPEELTRIGASAFQSCEKLRYISLPKGLTAIEQHAFSGCASLESITFPVGITSISTGTFRGCTRLKNVSLSPATVSIEAFSFSYCEALTSIELPPSVRNIGADAFFPCSNLDIHISDISAWCAIEFLSISCNPLSDGASLYLDGVLLTDLVLPEGIRTVKSTTFSGYQSLNSVTLPEGLTAIAPSAFSNCRNLSSITLPSTLEYIGFNAFANCFLLEQVHYNGTATQKTQILADEGNTFLFNKVWKLTPINFLRAIPKAILSAFYIDFLIYAAVIIVCFILERKKRVRHFYR